MKKYTYLLILVLLGAFFLSLYNLESRSLWLDEGVTFYNSGTEDLAAVTDRVAALDLSPPGYYYVMHLWQKISGTDTGIFRFLSVIFGVLSVYLVYLIGRDLMNKRVGIIAAFLLAINPFHIGFSEEARMYMMLTFFVLLALYSLLKILSEKDNAAWWLSFTIANTFGLFVHNSYLFAGFALGMCLLLFLGVVEKKGQTIGAALVSALVTLVMYIPWLPSLLKQLEVDRYWIKALEWHDVKVWLLDFVGGEKSLFYLLAFFGVLGVVCSANLVRKEENKMRFFKLLVVLIFGALAFAVPIIYSFVQAPLAKVRYFLFAPALISLFAALGIYSLKRIHSVLLILPLVFCVWIWQPWVVSSYPIEMNEDFRGVAQYIEEKSDDIPVVIHTPSANHVFSFYSDRTTIPFPTTFDLRNYNISEEDGELFLETVKDSDDFWLLITHSHENPQGILRSWSEKRCPQSDDQPFGPIYLARYTCG